MYICICKGITDSAIREAVCQGACRMRDLKTCLGVGTQPKFLTPQANASGSQTHRD